MKIILYFIAMTGGKHLESCLTGAVFCGIGVCFSNFYLLLFVFTQPYNALYTIQNLLEVFYLLDLFGVMVFAITGSLAAGKKQLDLFGALVLALVTALGGGTIRDIILGREPIFWISDLTYIYVVIVATLAVIVTARYWKIPKRTLLFADAFGLAVFSVLGAQIALQQGVPGIVSIIMGMLTGVAGGMIRDVFRDEIPLILHGDIYATAALAGATTFVILSGINLSPKINLIFSALVTLGLRLAAIKWNLSLPRFSTNQE